jgi:hypothetical protein
MGVCVLWCGVAVAATHPVLETWTAMLDYLGMRVRQECCGFEGFSGKDAT